MQTLTNHIKKLQEVVTQLTSAPFVPLEATALEALQECIAGNKNGLMRSLANLNTNPIPGSQLEKQLAAGIISISRLASRTYRSWQRTEADLNQQRDLLVLVASGLHELVNYAEFEFAERFPKMIQIPVGMLHNRTCIMLDEAEAALHALATHDLPDELVAVLKRYLCEFPHRETITFAQEAYHHKISISIRDWLARKEPEDAEHTLHRILCYFNFNRMDYLDLLRRRYTELASSSQRLEARMALLQQECAYWKILTHGVKWAYDPTRQETVHRYAINLLENIMQQVENEQFIPTPRDGDYLHFNFEQGEWSVLLDFIMAKKLFGPKTSRRKAAYILAAHFRTMDNRPLNAEVLRRADYPHADKDIVAFAAFAEDCQRWIKTEYPHLF